MLAVNGFIDNFQARHHCESEPRSKRPVAAQFYEVHTELGRAKRKFLDLYQLLFEIYIDQLV